MEPSSTKTIQTSDKQAQAPVPPDRPFALVAVVGPECEQKASEPMFMVIGTFATEEESQHYGKLINQSGEFDCFNTYTIEAGKFYPSRPPPPGEIKHVQYGDEFMNTMMTQARQHVDESKLSVQKKYADKPGVKCCIGKPQVINKPS